jgi:hypothetical protein
MDSLISSWRDMPWSSALLFLASLAVLLCIAFLLWDGWRNGTDAELRSIRRHNRRVSRQRIRARADEIDPAIVTGQFQVPRQMRDRK